MKLLFFLTLAAWVFQQTAARADSPAAPVPWMKTSRDGDYLFKMVPAKVRWDHENEKLITEREAFGVAYGITQDGDFHEIWRTEGWYTFEGYLSDDGRYFVRLGPWASDQEKHTDLAVAFYDNGKLLKQYAVRELIKKPELLEKSVSHYTWRPVEQTEPTGIRGGMFHLVMIDKTTHSFILETGALLISGEDAGAKSLREIWAAEEADSSRKGEELLKGSTFKEEYLPHFEIRSMNALKGAYYGCSLKGPAWTANLIPKQEFAEKTEVEAVFPVKDDKSVEVSLTPAKILSGIEKALRHPFISRRFIDGAASGLRLRIQGDRLHWNTPELTEFLEKITGKKPKEDELGHWAYFIIDSDGEPQFTSIYFNTQTGEIIGEDDTKWPWEPYLLDETGKRK